MRKLLKRATALFLIIALCGAWRPAFAAGEEDCSDTAFGMAQTVETDEVVFLKYAASEYSGEATYMTNWNADEGTDYGWKLAYTYRDDWFNGDAKNPPIEMLRMSVRAALCANGTYDGRNADNVLELMDALDFTYTASSVVYPTPSYDTIGTAIAAKNVAFYDGSEATILFTAIRGGNYGDEWGGNFHLGEEGDHAGFDIAADTVVSRIQGFLEENRESLKSDIRIWVMGYSRGAAVTNLTAAKLDRGAIKGITADKVYAFCFECPQGAVDVENRGGEAYSNITCVINPADAVTKLAPSAWDFGWYGKCYYLPDAANSKNYVTLKAEMEEAYRNIYLYNGKTASDYENDQPADFSPEQSALLDEIVDLLAITFVDRADYAENSEAALQEIITDFAGNSGSSSGIMLVFRLISALSNNPELADKLNSIRNEHSTLFNSLINMITSDELTHGHYPELCISWLDALDMETLSAVAHGYRKVFIDGMETATVKDSAGKTVASLASGEVNAPDDGIGCYLDEAGELVLILAEDESYRITLSGEKITYTVTRYDYDGGDTVMVKSYREVVTSGRSLIGQVGKTDENIYTLSFSGTGELTPSVEEGSNEAGRRTITAAAAGQGEAAGNILKPDGTFAVLTATPDEGAEFFGWYDEKGHKVSEELTYRHPIDGDAVLTAKFTGAEIEPEPEAIEVRRISGSNRYETAIEISKEGWDSAETVLLASGENYPDALAGAVLSKKLDAPILLTGKDSIKAEVVEEITRLQAKTVLLLGGKAAISEAVENSLTGVAVKRIAGDNRNDTAAKIAEELDPCETAFLVSNANFADALSISPVAAIMGAPILYGKPDGALPDETIAALQSHGVKKVYIIGGGAAIGENVQSTLENLGISAERVWGDNRYETSLKIAKTFSTVFGESGIAVATGRNFPDALAGAALAARMGMPVMLVGNSAEADQQSYVAESGASVLYVFGGTSAVGDEVVSSLIE